LIDDMMEAAGVTPPAKKSTGRATVSLLTDGQGSLLAFSSLLAEGCRCHAPCKEKHGARHRHILKA